MKLDTFVLLAKLTCYMLIGGLTPLAAGLSQWVNDGSWPPTICWIVVIAGCIVGAATQGLSFLSSSYSAYKTSRETTETTKAK